MENNRKIQTIDAVGQYLSKKSRKKKPCFKRKRGRAK